jgi:hypothetical protein
MSTLSLTFIEFYLFLFTRFEYFIFISLSSNKNVGQNDFVGQNILYRTEKEIKITFPTFSVAMSILFYFIARNFSQKKIVMYRQTYPLGIVRTFEA